MWLQTLLLETSQPKKKQSCGRVLFLIKFAKQFPFKGCKRRALACIHLTTRLCAHCLSGYSDHLEINGIVKTTGTMMEKQLNTSIRGTLKGTFNKDTCWLNLLDLIFWVKVLKRNSVISCSCQDNAASHPHSTNTFSFSIFKFLNNFIKNK